MLLHSAIKLGLHLERATIQLVIKMAIASKSMIGCLVEISIDIRGALVLIRCYCVCGNELPSYQIHLSRRWVKQGCTIWFYKHDRYYLKDRSDIRYRLK
jgi:hypothetical protein